tara:strand:- start:8764 stop:9747 length:984 start_codon:yes stop_codon:yes gene_type:complete
LLSVAVIGAGHWGRNLIRNFYDLGVLAAICDTNSETFMNLTSNYPEVDFFEGYENVFDSGIEAVAIATPAETHGKIARAALNAGKHVFVEKPICLNLIEAREIKELAEKENLILMVGHMLRYHSAFDSLTSVLKSGSIGKLRYIYSNRLSLGKIRREENALWSFAPHDISMILALTNKMPFRVSAHGESFLTPGIADTSLTHLDFGDQSQAHIFVSWLNPYKEHRLVVVGSDGMIVFDDTANSEEKLLLYPHQVEWNEGLPSVNKAEAQKISYSDKEPLKSECEHFIRCVDKGSRPITDAEEAIRVLRVLDASQRSLVSGQPITIEE